VTGLAVVESQPFAYRAAVAEEIPVLVSIPHTGTLLPAAVSRDLASEEMRAGAMADWHLDVLYGFLPELGIDVIHAVYHRFVIDLNRPPTATPLYPGRFETTLVPLETFQGDPVYARPPAAEEIARRVALYHAPYHQALRRRLDEKIAKFGHCYLIDAHSVESRPSRLHGALVEDVFLGEMCQRLYMTEGEPHSALGNPKFVDMQHLLRGVFGDLADAVLAGQCVRRL